MNKIMIAFMLFITSTFSYSYDFNEYWDKQLDLMIMEEEHVINIVNNFQKSDEKSNIDFIINTFKNIEDSLNKQIKMIEEAPKSDIVYLNDEILRIYNGKIDYLNKVSKTKNEVIEYKNYARRVYYERAICSLIVSIIMIFICNYIIKIFKH